MWKIGCDHPAALELTLRFLTISMERAISSLQVNLNVYYRPFPLWVQAWEEVLSWLHQTAQQTERGQES